MPVQFRDCFVCDMAPPLTLEAVYRGFGALGGVHGGAYDALLAGPAFEASEWSGSGAWSIGEQISGTGNSGAAYDLVWWSGSLPVSYVVDLALEPSPAWVVGLRGSGGSGYLFELTPSQARFLRLSRTSVEILGAIDNPASDWTAPGTLRIAVREMMLSDNDADRWLFLSAWLDDAFVFSVGCAIPTAPGRAFGLGARAGETSVVSALRIPDLTEIIPSASIDPDYTPLQGIQSAVHDRDVKMYVRWDGALRAWRPRPVSVAHLFAEDDTTTMQHTIDLRELATHVRLLYSLSWVEAYDVALYHAYGHRFREVTSGVIENEEDALTEAYNHLRRTKETLRQVSYTSPAIGPLLEPEDRVSLPDGEDYLVDTLTLSYTQNQLVTNLEGRHYVFDT
ncbi:hypothetical protein [Aggregatilinea lenta]|uniref:hypothetical protein n=1 Tax=Aggregatilinea lenta TaxID=913108 RepID=UPI000E5B6179|nr:hypothetical protein [Aggregatilinea lenta]